MLEVPLRSHRTELPRRPHLSVRKLAISGDTERKPDCEPCKVQFSDSQMYVSPVAPTGSYRMARVINGVEMFLLPTYARVYLAEVSSGHLEFGKPE